MTMSIDEAKAIAFAGKHATVTFDLAARVLRDAGARGRDHAAYIELAELKAAIQRCGYRYDWQEIGEP